MSLNDRCHLCGNPDTDLTVTETESRTVRRRCSACQADVEAIGRYEGSNPSAGWRKVASKVGMHSNRFQKGLQLLLVDDDELRARVAEQLQTGGAGDRPRGLVSFSPAERAEICEKRADGETLAAIADQHDTTFQNVQKIVAGVEAEQYWSKMQKNRETVKALTNGADTNLVANRKKK